MKITMRYTAGGRTRERRAEIYDTELAGMGGEAERQYILRRYVYPWVWTEITCGYSVEWRGGCEADICNEGREGAV